MATNPKKKEPAEKAPRLLFGCDLIDLMVGGDRGVYGRDFGDIINIVGDKSSGKAAPLTTHVLTPGGWKLMGDIKVGDVVCTPVKGETAPVLGVYPQGKRDVYRFHFNDGTTADTADMHLWVMQTANQYSSGSSYGRGRGSYKLTTREIADVYAHCVKPADRLALPMVDPVTFNSGEKLKVPPYLLGLLIADGGMTTSTPVITNPEKDVIDKASALARSVGLALNRKNGGISYGVVQAEGLHGRSWLPRYIRDMGLNCKSSEKRIPEAYMLAPVAGRIELLQGIFDGDGYVTKGGNLVYTTTSGRLAHDVADLCRSLGMRATLSHPKRSGYVKDGRKVECLDSYDVNIVPPGVLLPFSSRKHSDRYHASGREYVKAHRILQRVEYIGKQECQCIYIGHPSHLYIMDDYVPTHNTFLKNEMLAATYWDAADPSLFKFHSDDCESGDTFNTTGLYGVDFHPEGRRLQGVAVEDSATIEEMDAHVSAFMADMKPGEYGVYAVDSLDGLADATKLAMEEARLKKMKKGEDVQDEGTYDMQIPKFLSQHFFKTKHKKLYDKRVAVVIVSQIRSNTDAGKYGQKWRVDCGKALEFYAHTRIFLKTIRQIERGGDIVGAYVEATTKKSKTPRPYRSVRYLVYFDYGIDNVGSNIDYLFDLRADDGKLKEAANAIPWGSKSEETFDAVVKWLADHDWLTACKEDLKEDNGGKAKNLTKDWAVGWSRREHPEEYAAEFGCTYTRDELLRMMDDSKEMRAELTRLVREKWDAHEDAIATKRGAKYGR